MRIPQRYLLPVGIIVAFLLAGCGPNQSSDASPSHTRVPAISPTAVLIIPSTGVSTTSPTGISTTSPMGVPTTSPTSTPAASPTSQPPTSSVILQVGAASYQTGSTISVTIKNQSQQTIFFADHRTDCTVLQLERQVANSWEPVALCQLMTPTRFYTLNAGESLVVTLTPPGQWPIGRYRARLDYGVGSTGSDMSTIVYSSEFSVVS